MQFLNKKLYFLSGTAGLFLLFPSMLYAPPCATPGKDGDGVLSGIINTYFPSTGNVNAGATSIPLGPAAGANIAITPGDLLLVIQMQNAAINTTNSDSYGDGVPGDPGSGATNYQNVGLYEYVVATNIVLPSGGTLNLIGSGAGNGLLNSYTHRNFGNGNGQARYQVVRVPQYANAVLTSTLTALAWNGNVGGILAFDAAYTVNLNNAVVSVDGLGFRGGGGRQLFGDGGGNAFDYRRPANNQNEFHAPKGEGIAGVPEFAFDGVAVIDTGPEGYPNGSQARGAPANAGGGGSDGNPAANDQNSGGGGGANGGDGGQGGNAWNSNLPVGGFGGRAFPFVLPGRVVLGGGGGAGTRNNGAGTMSSGGRGGGMILIRARDIVGAGTLSANGAMGVTPDNDGGGGGGAGGSVVVVANTLSAALTVTATGGNGTDAWPNQAPGGFPGSRHGPGGGGGGGVVFYPRRDRWWT